MITRETQALTISSQMQDMAKVEVFIDELSSYFNINNDYFGNIIVAVTEAVENAITHGNREDADKKVDISFETVNGYMCFRVADQGSGFDYKSVQDPTDPFNENDQIGRGIYLMTHLTDKIYFEENGRVAVLCFAAASIHRELADRRRKVFLDYLNGVKVPEQQNNE